MGICNKTGGVLAPFAFSALIMGGLGEFVKRVEGAPSPVIAQALLHEFASRLYWPYLTLAAVLVVMAVCVARSSLPDITSSSATPPRVAQSLPGASFHFPIFGSASYAFLCM